MCFAIVRTFHGTDMETQENSNYLHKLLPQDKKQRCAGYQMLACYETDSDNEKSFDKFNINNLSESVNFVYVHANM